MSDLPDMLKVRNEISAVCHPSNIKHIDHDIMTMLYDCWIFLNQLIVDAKEYGQNKRTKHIVYRMPARTITVSQKKA